MRIGVLALQGAFIEHRKMLDDLGVQSFDIRQKRDVFRSFDGLILPGGESGVMGRLLFDLDIFDPILELLQNGMPALGTCAGLLLLAKTMENDSARYFATMDILVKRNAYGRQLGSFYTQAEFKGIGTIPMTFIRAPYIVSVDNDVEILAEVNGNIVAARQRNQLVTAFHPELSNHTSVHQQFLHLVS